MRPPLNLLPKRPLPGVRGTFTKTSPAPDVGEWEGSEGGSSSSTVGPGPRRGPLPVTARTDRLWGPRPWSDGARDVGGSGARSLWSHVPPLDVSLDPKRLRERNTAQD